MTGSSVTECVCVCRGVKEKSLIWHEFTSCLDCVYKWKPTRFRVYVCELIH